jgi:2'-5' RNA ligase
MITLRTFVAIELDESIKTELQQVQDLLAAQIAPRSVRWVRPAGIHLTLKFLGDTPQDKIEAIQAALVQATVTAQPFAIALAGLGCFPDLRRPQVVWVGLSEPTGALMQLRDSVESFVAPLGFPTERRAFRPHLTLGRVSRNVSSAECRRIGAVVASSDLGGTASGHMMVRSVSYIRSDLQASGAIYTTLFEANLLGV